MIRKRYELDCTSPPGQIVNKVGVPAGLYKPTHGGYPEEIPVTGWKSGPDRLLQDDSRKLSKALAATPEAYRRIK